MTTVLAAYLHSNTVSHNFLDSMLRLSEHNRSSRLVTMRLALRCGPGALVHSRNQCASTLLDETDCDYLWLIDTDMGFHADVVDRLVDEADPVTRPVVGALCHSLLEQEPDGIGGWHVTTHPTAYDWTAAGYTPRRDLPPDHLVRVDATGAACLLIHRDVLAKLRAEHGDHWFDLGTAPDGGPMGEDLSFCRRLNHAGVPIHVHTGIRTSHHKSVWLS